MKLLCSLTLLKRTLMPTKFLKLCKVPEVKLSN